MAVKSALYSLEPSVKELAVNENEWVSGWCFEFRRVGEWQEAQGSAKL